MDAEKNRYYNEEKFHDTIFKDSSRGKVSSFYKVANKAYNAYKNKVIEDIQGRTLLEYGCGVKSEAFSAAKLGGVVTGIDISGTAINISKSIAKSKKLNIEFYKMNAEDLQFAEKTFDKICGSGILHHLDINRASKELYRVLNDDGKAVFIEPLGYNPIINLYRLITPKLRTKDEHPLKLKDLKLLQKQFRVGTSYHCLVSLISILFLKSKYFRKANKILNKIDSFILRIPIVKNLAWIVIIELSKK